MDIKLKNNDIFTKPNGDTVYITGMDEIVQRVKIACSIKKGNFIYDRNLGADTENIDFSDEHVCSKLSMVLSEAIINIPDTEVRVISVTNNDDIITAQIKVTHGTQEVVTEVTING